MTRCQWKIYNAGQSTVVESAHKTTDVYASNKVLY